MHNANGTELFPAGLSLTAFGPSIRQYLGNEDPLRTNVN